MPLFDLPIDPVTSPNRKHVHYEGNSVCNHIRGSSGNKGASHDIYTCIQMCDDLQLLEPIPALALLQYLWHLKQVLFLNLFIRVIKDSDHMTAIPLAIVKSFVEDAIQALQSNELVMDMHVWIWLTDDYDPQEIHLQLKK